MLQCECLRRLNKKNTLEQALRDLIVIILIEVFDLILLILPPVKTGLKCVRMSDTHTVDLRPYGVLLIFCDAVGTFRNVESILHLLH